MAELVHDDIVEQILVRLCVKDLLRFKSVCKSWLYIISGSRFIKSHLNKSYINDSNNNELGHRRIIMFELPRPNIRCRSLLLNKVKCPLLGSSNGLLCLSMCNSEVVVVNPLTREVRKLQKPRVPDFKSSSVCWGFGYDSVRDDYKVVLGVMDRSEKKTCFQVLTLKSNAWKVIGNVKYTYPRRFGVLCNGAIHWFMTDQKYMKVILSFDLSKDEFKEIPHPDPHASYKYQTELTVIKDCLCIVEIFSSKKWVMKNYNVKQSWELSAYDCENNFEINNDNAYYLRKLDYYTRIKKSFFEDKFRCSTREFILFPIFVQSLVSPMLMGDLRERQTM